MKALMSGLSVLAGLAMGGAACAGESPAALIYISPHEFAYEVQVGAPPYFNKWVLNGPVLEAAARSALAPHFSGLELCDGTSGADVLVWVKPQLSYNPGMKRYYAKVKAQFHLGSGPQIGGYKAMGEQDGDMRSVYADQAVRQAYDKAMRDIVAQYLADAKAQQAIAEAVARDMTKVPCALIGAVPKP